jgi:hypothetical protein
VIASSMMIRTRRRDEMVERREGRERRDNGSSVVGNILLNHEEDVFR